MTLRLSPQAFFNHTPESEEFDELQYDCLQSKSTIELVLEDDHVCLEVVNFDTETRRDSLVVYGSSKIDLARIESKGEKLLAPLLCGINRLRLPSSQIFSFRMGKRSIADFFMQNLYHSLCRVDGPSLHIVRIDDSQNSLQQDFSRCYLWILRSQIEEPVFTQKDMFEKLTVNSLFKTIDFENLLLASGAAEIREKQTAVSELSIVTDQDERLFRARAAMQSHFG